MQEAHKKVKLSPADLQLGIPPDLAASNISFDLKDIWEREEISLNGTAYGFGIPANGVVFVK